MPQPESRSIALPATLDYLAAPELASDLREHRHEPVRLDASAVQHLGASCLQVLLAAARTWQGDALDFTVENASAAFSEGLARLGCEGAHLSFQGDAS